MRWGIFGDIHGNLEALEAVLAAFKKETVDKYLCLGDVVGYGADPVRCIAEIKRLGALTIAGNHDWASVGLFEISYFNPQAKKAVLWTRQNLTDEDRQFLKSLELVYREKELTLVHGSLQNPEGFNYIFDISSAAETFQLLDTRICFIGHSHVPIIFIQTGRNYRYTSQAKVKIETEQRYIVNAGSVGQPRDGDPQASYVVYDDENRQLQIKRVAYNIRQTQEKIIKAGLPKILAERLSYGR